MRKVFGAAKAVAQGNIWLVPGEGIGMPNPTTAEEFIELAKKSGVVDEKRLNAALDKLRAGSGIPAEPGKLAGILVRDGVMTHFQADQFLHGRWRRFTIGKYKVLEKLGSGGMGHVYLCEHKFMRRRAAVKVLPVARAEDPSSLERFYREARAVAALDHPNIVRAYDIDHEDDLHFLVMEYVDGSSLQEIVKKHGPMDIARACHYIRQAAVGLQHAHKAGLIHRDIKPGNILVDRNGVVKVLDMGLARFFHDEDDVLTKKFEENVLGTADYLAPEQALDSHGVDIRADIYSLGATFYFILTGSTPFSEGTVAQKLIWHQTRQPKPVQTVRPEVPEELAAVIEKMMAKDPAQRYQTPAEAVEALTPFTQQPIPPPPEREMPRLTPAATGPLSLPDSGLSGPAAAAGMPSPTPSRQIPAAPSPFRPSTLPPRKSTPDVSASASEPAPTLPIPYLGKKSNQGLAAGAKPETFPMSGPKAGSIPSELGRPTLATPVENPPLEDSGILAWDRLTSDTDNPIARADTALGTSRSGLASSFNLGKHPHFWWIIVGGTALVLGAAILFFWVLEKVLPTTSSKAKSSPHAPQTFLVTTSTEKPHSFSTIREALKQARPGDHILVQKESHEEQLLLEDGRWGNGVTIEGQGPDGARVIWRIPKDLKSKRPRFIELAKTENLRLRGFTLDGDGRVEDLVVLFGHCPGLTLEDLRFQGFSHCAVNVFHCAGKAENPVSLAGLRAIVPGSPGKAASGPSSEAALIFSYRDNILNPKENQFVRVQDCVFAGPYRSAVQLTGPAFDIEFRRNRFYGADCGINFKAGKQPSSIQVTLANNTFCQLKTALQFDALPRAEENPEENQIVLERNLFAQTAVIATANKPSGKDPNAGANLQLLASQLFQSARGNVRDPSSQDGNIVFEILSVPFAPLPQDPNDDKKFLRYSKDSPLVERGSPGVAGGE
jgi:serine/threonine protein kinase